MKKREIGVPKTDMKIIVNTGTDLNYKKIISINFLNEINLKIYRIKCQNYTKFFCC